MFKIALVIFREMLEISLILGIVSAATKAMPRSRFYIIAGIIGGIACSALLAFAMTHLASTFSYGILSEEIADVIIIMLTVFVIAITAIWVKNSAAKLNGKIIRLKDAPSNMKAGIVLICVIVATILREGAEIVLFVQAISSAYDYSSTDYAIGFGIGVSGGILSAILISYGLGKVATKYVFTVSFVLLSLVAASLASEAAGILTSLGMVDLLTTPIWDSSDFVSDFSVIGKLLKMLVGYNSKPNGLQLAFYTATLLLIYIGSKLGKGRNVKVTS